MGWSGQERQEWWVKVGSCVLCPGKARQEWQGPSLASPVEPGQERLGKARKDRPGRKGEARRGVYWYGVAGMDSNGDVWPAPVRQERHGDVCSGSVSQVMAGKVR